MTVHFMDVAPPVHGPAAMLLHATPTLSSRIVGRLIEQASHRGLAPTTIRQLHRVTGMNPLHDDETSVRVSMHGYFGLWAEIVRATQNPGLPIELASTIAIEDFQLLGFLMMTSASGMDAIQSLCRYLPLLTEGGEWSFESTELHVARWRRIVDAGELEERVANEFAVAQYVRVLRQVRRTELAPARVTFKHRQPTSTKVHAEFFRCPIEWCAPVDSVCFDPRALQFAPPLANPSLHTFLRAQADEIIALRGAPSSLTEQIREAIAVELPSGPPPLSRVARRLAMSERSLRRTLHREQQSFRQIVDGVRKDRAIELLRSGHVSIAEVSSRLGFSDPSAFSRAFKRWCGRSPQSFRPACRVH
jgi:AraC-like DNA-binding protein